MDVKNWKNTQKKYLSHFSSQVIPPCENFCGFCDILFSVLFYIMYSRICMDQKKECKSKKNYPHIPYVE